ncbi:MAG: manganese efflux pump [bacterium]|nr:manganese efflux pump [bacterium]
MSYIEIFLLALALSVDACIVSFSYGILGVKHPKREKYLLSVFTGIFQGVMPIFGYFLTGFVIDFISPVAKFLVFLIFAWLGIKFITESFEKKQDKIICLDIKHLLLIGIATSIDAFSAGISLKVFGNFILKPACLIGLITFINSQLGFSIGMKFKNIPINFAQIVSGIILIALGIKSLF